MKRNFGFRNEVEMLYSAEQFRDGCTFNYWMGAGSGVVGVVGIFLAYTWFCGWW